MDVFSSLWRKPTISLAELPSWLKRYSEGDPLEPQIQRAWYLGHHCHAHETRKDKKTPYFEGHCVVLVRMAVEKVGIYDALLIIILLLHDVLEIKKPKVRGMTRKFFQIIFGEEVAVALYAMKRKKHGGKKKEPEAPYVKRIVAPPQGWRTLLGKLLDRVHSLQTLEHLELKRQWEVLEETKQYYPPLIPVLEAKLPLNLKWVAGRVSELLNAEIQRWENTLSPLN